ncbi:MAG: MBL fold metallo-hydrolase, partial [Planctomycetes bacterium]|nr:MBL fold metallo-hydrolase [Planctomycetota bacterium]
DCGSLHAPTRAARQLVDACPIRRLDWLVLTHADHDHHNGTAALLQRAEVRRALLPRELADSEVAALLRTHGAELAFLAPGERLAPTPGIEVAAPVLATDGTTNDRSLWTTFAAGGTRVLFCGDAESEGIRAAIAQGVAAASAVLVLPHHGRDDPAVPELLAVVRPACCLASAASSDAATAAGEIARAFGAEVFVTGLDGDVEVELGEVARVRVEVGWRVLRSGQ